MKGKKVFASSEGIDRRIRPRYLYRLAQARLPGGCTEGPCKRFEVLPAKSKYRLELTPLLDWKNVIIYGD